MVKSLVERVKENVKKSILIASAVASLGFAGCKLFPNAPPTAILHAYQQEGSGDNPVLVVKLDGTDLDGKSDIIEYKISITDSNGTNIKNISDKNPINETIPLNDGTFYISGECKDSQGETDSDGPIEITILRNNYLPLANLNVTPTSGISPLEVLISLDGTDGNGIEDIIEYKIEIDKNEDEVIDETIIESSPIINRNRTFNTTTNIYGKCKDSRGAISSVGPKRVTIEPAPTPTPDPDPTPIPDPDPPINHAPIITSTPITSVNEGNFYNYDVEATDADVNDTLTYSLTAPAPTWLSINSSTGLISGTAPLVPLDTIKNISVEVSDGINPVVTQAYTLIVKDVLIPPTPILSISSNYGNVPLETKVSISGIKTDADIAGYKVWFDKDDDEIVDDGEIIINSISPIIDKKILITETGIKKIYGICTDSNNLAGRTKLEEIIVRSLIQPDDLTETINFPDKPYYIGKRLTFATQITNNDPLNRVTFDNLNRQSLEFKLFRKIGRGIYEQIIGYPFKNEVTIILNPKMTENKGYIKVEQKNDDKVYLTIANADIFIPELPGIPISVGDIEGDKDNRLTYSETCSNFIFEKEGDYIVQTSLKYLFVNETQTRTLNFLSSEFVVQP